MRVLPQACQVSAPYHGVTIADVELMIIMMGGKV